MNARTGHLRWLDFAVCAICAALVLMVLGAVGETGRRRAKEAVCQANLYRWGDIFGTIIEENNGQFLSGVTSMGYWWPLQLAHQYQDWRRNRTWFCPTATVPTVDEHGVFSGIRITVSAWGIFSTPHAMSYKGRTYTMNPNGLAGSYGLNGYTLSTESAYEGGIPASQGWTDLLNLPEASRVPMFIDAPRFDVWPQASQAPAAQEENAWSSSDMGRVCINRHDGAVNCLFVDGSVRKVGLKELWTLQWHRSFDTAGPWTKAGGVLPEDWPQWMRPFKDY